MGHKKALILLLDVPNWYIYREWRSIEEEASLLLSSVVEVVVAAVAAEKNEKSITWLIGGNLGSTPKAKAKAMAAEALKQPKQKCCQTPKYVCTSPPYAQLSTMCHCQEMCLADAIVSRWCFIFYLHLHCILIWCQTAASTPFSNRRHAFQKPIVYSSNASMTKPKLFFAKRLVKVVVWELILPFFAIRTIVSVL